MNTYYGSYRTRTFAEIFPSYEEFQNAWAATHFAEAILPSAQTDDPGVDTKLAYIMLYARYGNSHIAFSDENQFAYNIFNTMFMYGPTWSKRLQIQKRLRGLKSEDIEAGATIIYNHAENPNAAPSTQATTELNYINDQNVHKHKRNKLDAYANLIALLDTDVSEEFITKFRKFFIQVIAPDTPLLYATYPNTIETEDITI